jgi:hypothetical protein
MDLERDCLWVWGIAKEGHFRFKLSADEVGLCLFVDRCPKDGLTVGSQHLHGKDKILLLSGGQIYKSQKIEKLSLGNWKEQDWDLVRRRNDVREWVPVLYSLGQKTPVTSMVKGGPVELLEELTAFFPAAFSGILVPHLIDPLHQGLFSEEGHGDPLALLPLAFKKIRSFLIQDKKILPALPRGWDCGRALGLQTEYGRLDLEWTRGSIRQMVLYCRRHETLILGSSETKANRSEALRTRKPFPDGKGDEEDRLDEVVASPKSTFHADGSIHADLSGEARFLFSKQIRSFRLNGKRMERDSFFPIESGKKYHFDRFQK